MQALSIRWMLALIVSVVSALALAACINDDATDDAAEEPYRIG